MAKDIDESLMRKFVHKVFKKSDDIGNLTVKSVRQQFLEHLGLEKLDSDQKEVFKNIVHDIYTLYSNKHQEHNGHQGSNLEDSQTTTETDDVSDPTVSSSSASSRRKKRKRRLNSDDDSSDLNSKSEKKEQKEKTVSEKETLPKTDKEGVQKEKNITSKTKPSQEIYDEAEQNDSNSEDGKQRKNSASARSLKIDDAESDVSNSEEEAQRTKHVSKNKAPQKIDRNLDSTDSNSEEEVPRKKNASRKKQILHENDNEESGDSNNEEEAPRKKNALKKKRSPEIDEDAFSGDSNSEDQMNEEQQQSVGRSKSNHDNRDVNKDEIQKRKRKKKSKDTSSAERKKKSSPPSVDSIRLKNLKRFVRTCGLHKNYVKLFAECDSMSQKEKTLERVLRKDTGFEGRITLGMCKKFKQAKEEADEIAELDCNNIISADHGRRPTRTTRAGSDKQSTPSTVPNLDGPKLFSRLKGVVDSDGSDSEEEQQRGKRTPNTSPEKLNGQENSRKRRRLNSSSDDDD